MKQEPAKRQTRETETRKTVRRDNLCQLELLLLVSIVTMLILLEEYEMPYKKMMSTLIRFLLTHV